jgi:alpha-galactosidase
MAAEPASQVYQDHQNWFSRNREGNLVASNRGTYMLCPLVPGVQEFHKQMVQRIIGEYDIDILKIDIASMDYAPPCYDERHRHAYPEEPMEQYWRIVKIMYETGLAIKPGYIQLVCSCGLPHSPFTMPYYNMAHVSDPYSIVQARRRVKVHKALQGPRIAMQSRPVEGFEVSRMDHVFASWIGLGLRIATSFVLEGHEKKQIPRYNKKSIMTAEKYPIYTKWFTLFHQLQLGMSEYISVYDIAYDFPEGHLLRKGDRMYYAFFTDSDANVPSTSETWEGTLELRGLEASPYTVYDYEHKRNLGTVQGPVGRLRTAVDRHLLLECVPE